MLTSLRLRNFKSFADAQAPFGPLTLLVGANASGKSNVLDALQLLKGYLGQMLPLDQVLRGTRLGWGWPGIRGGLHELVRNGAETFVVESSWQMPPELLPPQVVEHLIECAVTPEPLVRRERLAEAGAQAPYFDRDSSSAALQPKYRHVPTPHVAEGAYSTWADDGYIRLDSLRRKLHRLQFLDLMPRSMRGYVPQEMRVLGEDGENLSAVLWKICQDTEDKRELVDWLSELCSPELADIDFSTTDEGEVMLRLIERDGTRISARSLSDGTLRFLGELVALRTAPEGSTILIEELGRELHPSRVHLLVQYLESITEERHLQVIATTHSPLVLQALGPRTRNDVVALGRVQDVPGTVMRRVGDLPHFEEVAERRGLDYLFTTHWLEQAL